MAAINATRDRRERLHAAVIEPEDLVDAREIVEGWRLRLAIARSRWRLRAALEPEAEDMALLERAVAAG